METQEQRRGRRGVRPRSQRRLTSVMEPGQVFVFNHEGYAECRYAGPAKGCSLGSVIRKEKIRRSPDVFIFSTHVDGKIVVACADLRDEVPI